MNYTIQIYENAAGFAARNDSDQNEAFWAAIGRYLKALKDAGVFVGGAGLQSPETAVTLRFEGDRRWVQDGPYADTKEKLGGFFIINVPDMDIALEWAGRFPHLAGRVVEVRPNLPSEE